MRIRTEQEVSITGSFNAKLFILPGVRMFVITDMIEMMEKRPELKASESRFKALAQEGADLIAILDDDGN